uniref:Putative secreted protein n=1 Tax=Anopheles marajoara TaxID=58244 RepID=A0A2M4CAV0_9DIPT
MTPLAFMLSLCGAALTTTVLHIASTRKNSCICWDSSSPSLDRIIDRSPDVALSPRKFSSRLTFGCSIGTGAPILFSSFSSSVSG